MNIGIRHLRIFIAVATSGSMSAAAKELFISQPSISQAIKEIEDYYGIRLFERLAKRLYITENGKQLLKYARHIVTSFNEMEVSLKHSGESITLIVGGTVTVGTCILNKIIKNYEQIDESTTINAIINNTNIIEGLILQSNIDVAVVEGEITHEDIIKIPIYKDKLVLVVGREHHFYNRKSIKLDELYNQYLISREEGSGGRELFEQILEKNNIKMKTKWSCTTTEAIKSATIAGEGVAVLSTLIVEQELKNKTLHIVEIEDTEIYRDICVVFHKDKFLTDKLNLFIKCAEEYKN